jgi:hypothetical protein
MWKWNVNLNNTTIMKTVLTMMAMITALLPGPTASVHAAADKPAKAGKPNIILILTDDQGFGDIAAHGNPILRTPHLDRTPKKCRDEPTFWFRSHRRIPEFGPKPRQSVAAHGPAQGLGL